MAGTTGREMKGYAFRKFGTNSWGVAASVTRGTRFTSDGGLKPSPSFVEDRSFGETFLGASSAGDFQPLDLTLSGQARYEDYNYGLEALAMGSPAAVAISTSASGQTTSWVHVFDLAPSIDGLGATFAIDRKLYVEELTSAKIYGFGETVGENGICETSFKVLGNKATNLSSVNARANSTVYTSTYPALGGKRFRNQGTFRLNVQSGGALGSTDAQTIEAFSFTFERPQDRSFSYGSDSIIEPADNEFPTVSMQVTFPRMNTVSANSLYGHLTAGTAFKADITYLGAYINSTDRLTTLYQFPYVELQDFATPTQGAAQVKPTATFMVKEASSAPTGMSGVTKPFRLTKIMQNSVAAFSL
jgi:hypothetical protein